MMKSRITHIHHKGKLSGFTLLEVLITLVILAIGLLGLAGLQAIGLQQNHSAYQRTQATLLAYDIADRMRANIDAIDNYRTAVPQSKPACLTSPGCASIVMAQHDLYEWDLALKDALPTPVAAITNGAAGTYLIRITWLDDRKNNTNTQFDMSFLP